MGIRRVTLMIRTLPSHSGSLAGHENASVTRSTRGDQPPAAGCAVATSTTTTQTSVTADPIAIATTPSTHPATATLRPPSVPREVSTRLTDDLPRKYARVPSTMPGIP